MHDLLNYRREAECFNFIISILIKLVSLFTIERNKQEMDAKMIKMAIIIWWLILATGLYAGLTSTSYLFPLAPLIGTGFLYYLLT